MASSWYSMLRLPVIASSAIAAVSTGLLYFKQNELIYPRNIPVGSRTEEGVPKPPQFGVSDWQDLRLRTPDNEWLSAYLIRPSASSSALRRGNVARSGLGPNTTVLMFHGNAGNIGHRVPIARVIAESTGAKVLMLEYRGYGLSTGTPNEDGLKIDAQTALDWIRRTDETKDTRIVVYGQSLGGAVAINLVHNNMHHEDIRGLILENTFLSIRKMIPNAFPPAKYLAPLCHQRWASEETLPLIKNVPILFLSGLLDEIVPPAHMKQLFEQCTVQHKTWRELPTGSHNDSVAEPYYFDYVAAFLSDPENATRPTKEDD